MRENRLSGSEGGGTELNWPSLPLFNILFGSGYAGLGKRKKKGAGFNREACSLHFIKEATIHG